MTSYKKMLFSKSENLLYIHYYYRHVQFLICFFFFIGKENYFCMHSEFSDEIEAGHCFIDFLFNFFFSIYAYSLYSVLLTSCQFSCLSHIIEITYSLIFIVFFPRYSPLYATIILNNKFFIIFHGKFTLKNYVLFSLNF